MVRHDLATWAVEDPQDASLAILSPAFGSGIEVVVGASSFSIVATLAGASREDILVVALLRRLTAESGECRRWWQAGDRGRLGEKGRHAAAVWLGQGWG